jgi:hypothetical protein
MEIIKNNIKNIINKDNNDKLLIGIIDIIYYLNNTIMNSLSDSSFLIFKENRIFFNNDYRNINTFEYHYNCLKNISKKNIIDAFKQHSEKYLNILVDIYFIIKEKIKENKNILKNKFTNIIPISIRYKKKFGLKNLYEWKFILSSLKIYVYSFYVTNINLEKIEYNFSYEILFHISVKLYFIYYQNNIYQNIFIGIINIICNEKCPSYLTEYFLLTNKSNQNLIDLIISNLENGNNNKINKLLVGPNIEILKLFYYSNNKTIEKFLKKDLYENYKNLYKKYITPKFERKLNNDYNFSDSEIFINDNNETFDGKDINAKYIKVNSIQQTLQNFLDKCKYEKDINKKTRRISIKKIKRNKENIIKEKSNITTYNNLKERETILERTFPNNESPFEIEISSKFELKNNY